MLSTTAFLAAAMQCAASVHPTTALDIARVESGFHPYAIAEIVPKHERAPGDHGVISHYPADKADAVGIARRLAAQGRRYSVGLMQITSTNFRHYGVTAHELFDPCINLSVFERILTGCYRRGGSLKRALSCYYSGDFDTGQRPEAAFDDTSYVQRIGYAVPSTREEKQRPPTENAIPTIHYPTVVLRGDMADNATPAPPSVRYPNAVMRGALPVPEIHEEK
ncbi:lytic transglycosylase domain-containing protein [Brenneria goodwinii]|uniref:Bores hole in peptidoglycan layer allowing type IV secretion complex assembly to occur (VirB1) n=1 Tax=Brenneria goodwinii TaxID=1109412 RepID=A0A0G4JYV4_9GAMM|nr:lytic transglycosylase domain-containing protein [Brenneria goodwinii]MCG8154947.1 lytic transglycosylase domain-containing protein [Brenneria goodwinii]MCG8162790.1 lytic transglycosylase domain-containing protein [Brenneria goodwinii]MCG8164185.1 lytic transglycosylase domain-containing protein [Brenneria goodwinii]MCG8168794.1 lytic transglycosylase domain-containing protein [Brenneria goodwinii]MCG8173651.1 lytic transglycosylase domain-containing protein [Brenneria goodwinii]